MGAFSDFDNTARRGKNAAIFIGATPNKFYQYLVEIIKRSIQERKEYIFITAWNEWGEGNYLEPDLTYKNGFLNAVRKNIENSLSSVRR